MNANTRLSPKFLADLAEIYAELRPPPLSADFLADLKRVYDTLPVASDDNLRFLAERFDEWRKKTRELVCKLLAKLNEDDPLLCRISLFRTMDYGRLETAHTRTLAWLLDPAKDEEHGFGDALLAALLKHLAERDHFDRLQVERVVPEHFLEGAEETGRSDVLAEGEWESKGERVRWVLVIEAKIDAEEGVGQLDKYDEWLDSHAAGRETYRVFLTPDGRPSDGGCGEWTALSFRKLVQIFRTVYSTLRYARGFHFLRFYLAGLLQDVCGLPRNVTDDTADPYAIASYLKTVRESRSEGVNHDTTR